MPTLTCSNGLAGSCEFNDVSGDGISQTVVQKFVKLSVFWPPYLWII